MCDRDCWNAKAMHAIQWEGRPFGLLPEQSGRSRKVYLTYESVCSDPPHSVHVAAVKALDRIVEVDIKIRL